MIHISEIGDIFMVCNTCNLWENYKYTSKHLSTEDNAVIAWDQAKMNGWNSDLIDGKLYHQCPCCSNKQKGSKI